MSLILFGSTKDPHKDLVFHDAEWIHQVQEDIPLTLTYTNTVRKAPVVIDTLRSKRVTERGKGNAKLLTPVSDGGFKFLGKEIMWSNKLRLSVIADGIHMYVPQVLYLVRPETAYTACLHYLAEHLGGAEGYLAQRSFIFQNPGITTLMKSFWNKVQTVAWSGGMAPSISEEERAMLILALVEAFNLTRSHAKGKDGLYVVPHVHVSALQKAGMYFPSLEDPVKGGSPTTDDEPTTEAVKTIIDAHKRQNLPGIPSDLAAYLTCYVCNNVFDTPAEAREHKKHNCKGKVKCDACGLEFENAEHYQLHAVTFCRQGPHTQGKCPTCSTMGPRCLCQVHWARTYALAAKLFEGTHGRGEWLTLYSRNAKGTLDSVVSSELLLARVYSGIHLIPDAQTSTNAPESPFALSPTLWEPKNVRLPMGSGSVRTDLSLKISEGKALSIDRMMADIEGWFTLRYNMHTKHTTPHKTSEDKQSSVRKAVQIAKHLEGGALNGDEYTTEEELDTVAQKIALAEETLDDPKGKKLLLLSLGLTEDEVRTKLQGLKDLESNIAAGLLRKTPFKSSSLKKKREMSSTTDLNQHTSNSEFDFGIHSPTGPHSPRDSPSPTNIDVNNLRSFLDKQKSESKMGRLRGRKLEFEDTSPPRRKRSGSSSKSPGARTATSTRGSSWTHTLYNRLSRALSLLKSVDPDPKSSPFKRHREKLIESIDQANKHLTEDDESTLDEAYVEDLDNLVLLAEDILDETDLKADKVEKNRQEEKEKKDLISKCLPRTHAIKWEGTRHDYMRFRKEAQTLINTIPNDRLALNAILDIISDQKLRRRLARHKSPQEALESLELQFGNPELSGPQIIKDLRHLTKATTHENEAALILKIRELFAQLAEIDQEQLLGIDVLLSLCHKFRERQGEALQEKLQTEKHPRRLREIFCKQIDMLYTLNTTWSRTDEEKDKRQREPPKAHREQFKNRGRYTDTRRTAAENDNKSCKICKGDHPNFRCPTLATMSVDQVKKYQVCPHCLWSEHEKCPHLQKPFVCKQCNFHRKLTKAHINCKPVYTKEGLTPGQAPGPSFPKKGLSKPQQASKTDNTTNRRFQAKRDFAWRSQGGPVANPNPMNSALEVIDHVIIEAPNGNRRRVRVIHDQFGATDCLSDINLAPYSHSTRDISLTMHASTGSSHLNTEGVVLKLLLADGSYCFLDTIATEMRTSRAFTLQSKSIDLPAQWNSLYFGNTLNMGPTNNNMRCVNFTEGPEIELLLGSDAAYLAPVEIDRYADQAGCVTLYDSKLQNEYRLLGGSRIVGLTAVPPPTTHHHTFRVDSSNEDVVIRRSIAHKQNAPILFPENPIAKMSKTDQHFFKNFQDNNLLPPHPRACKGCAECPTCSDISAIQRRKIIEANLDKLCTLDVDNPWPQGGWRIKLLWNSLKPQVPFNEEDSVRRFLATERSLLRSPSALKTFNEQVQKCLDKGYFVLAKNYTGDLTNLQVSYLPLSYALKDTVEDTDNISNENSDTDTKTKARPVSDGSHRSNLHTPSVNEALVPIPDLWTGKIQHLLLKFRTAQRLAIADISQYYHRLRLDQTSVSMTRAIWRENGIGGTGELTTMIVPSASMGLTPVPALASHCRARTADMVEDATAKTSLQESYVDDIYQPTLWMTSKRETPSPNTHTHPQALTLNTKRSPPEPDKTLIERIEQVEKALSKAQLQLGGSGWITDIKQDALPKGKTGITGITDTISHRDVGVSTTGALGLRWNLGTSLPDGGTFSYRVHRPGSINLMPKKRGKRPSEGEMRNRADISHFLEKHGLSKAGLLRLVMNLFDVLQLALPWACTAKLLYREVLTENPGLGWKQQVPKKYFTKVEDLASDLILLSTSQAFPRRAIHLGPDGTIGHLTLILVHDASAESACVLAYIHQQWPYNSATLPPTVTGNTSGPDNTKISTKVSLLCGAHKLAETGHEEQVSSELLSATIAVRLKRVVLDNSLINFDKVIYLGDSLTVARVIRKSNRAYNTWAGTRVSFIQRNENLDNMFHVPGKFLIPTADKGTRAHKNPSSLMDEAYWPGIGTLDAPLHLLPITPPSQYTTTSFNELPSEWLHKSTVELRPTNTLLTVTCHRVENEEDDHTLITDSYSLERLKIKFRSFKRLKRIMMHILKLSPAHKNMTAHQLLTCSEDIWLSLDHDILTQSLKNTSLPQSFIVEEDKSKRVYRVRGRSGFSVPLLANPKKSRLTRVILKQYHDANHCTSPATIQALVFKDFFVMGGAASYIKKLGNDCPRCHLLRARPSQALAGTAPAGTQGPLPTDKSIWRRWMADILGPIFVTPWSGKKQTRAQGPSKSLKHWILLTVDLCSRQVDAVLIEGYSAVSVLTGMRELMARHGPPQHIYWDRASNLHAAAALFRDDTDTAANDVDVKRLVKVQEELQRSFRANGITVHLSIPYASHRQGRIEANVKRIKNTLVQLCFDESQTKLTPMEVTSTLAAACEILNQRPLLLTAESTIEEKNILCPAYLTCTDLDLKHTSCSNDEDTQRMFNIHPSPLTRRATMIQDRIELFKETFNTFMTKNLTSLGKFNKEFNKIEVGDVCLILDKVRHDTLPVQSKRRYTLGVVEKMLSDRSCELRYARHSEGGKYKTFICERSIQNLALIVKSNKIRHIQNQDIILDPIFPVDKILENDASQELKTTEIITGKSNEIDNNEDEIHQDKLSHAHTEEDTPNNPEKPTNRKIGPVITFVADTDVPAIKTLRKRRAHKSKE